ncbi:hypothetical protein Bca4012_049239 [Brassica carinata]
MNPQPDKATELSANRVIPPREVESIDTANGGDNNPIDDIPGVGSVKTKASNGVTNAPILE